MALPADTTRAGLRGGERAAALGPRRSSRPAAVGWRTVDLHAERPGGSSAPQRFDKEREQALAASPDEMTAGLESLLSPADKAVLHGGLAEFLTYAFQAGLKPGGEGWWEDNCLLRPWGFELAGIAVPVLLMHGRQDNFVPFGHGQWLAGHIPGVEARLLDHDGHLTLIEHRIPEVHAWLAGHL